MACKRSLFSAAVFVGLMLAAAPPARSVGNDGATAQGVFARAESLYRQLSTVDPSCTDPAAWETLALAFGEVPKRFPTSPVAGDALWRIGDIHSRQLAAGLETAEPHARDAYQTLITRYPTSPFAPSSYLKLAELADRDGASSYYYQLLQRYPRTDEAGEARRRLANPAAVIAATTGTAAVAAPSAPRSGSTNKPLDEVSEAAPTPTSGIPSGLLTPGGGLSAPAEDLVIGRVTGVRHYSDGMHTRVVFDLDRPIQHRIGEAKSPPRLYVDLIGAELPDSLARSIEVDGSGVRRVRLAVNRPGVVRVVLDLRSAAAYEFFTLADPPRLVIDVPSPEMSERLAHARRPPAPEGGSEARQLNLGVRRIVIDPGHGGSSPGAIGRSGVIEKDLVLDISRRLAGNLRKSDYEVILTRDADTSLDLESRPVMATEAHADLFLSIHINSANSSKLSGFETYYLDLATDPTAAETAARENAQATGGVGNLDEVLKEIVKNANKRESRDLAHSIQDSLVLQTNKRYKDVRDLGVKHAPFVVLVGANMPAVLVELSFVSNPTEEDRLRDPDYRQQLADAIHIGVENYVAKRRMLSSTH